MKASNQSLQPSPKIFASRLAPFRNKLAHSLPLTRPSACPSMPHRFPAGAIQRACHDTLDIIQVPGFPSAIETRSLLTLTRSYPRRFTFYVA